MKDLFKEFDKLLKCLTLPNLTKSVFSAFYETLTGKGKAAFQRLQKNVKVTSSGIEPESGASEALILSIVLRGLIVIFQKNEYCCQIF